MSDVWWDKEPRKFSWKAYVIAGLVGFSGGLVQKYYDDTGALQEALQEQKTEMHELYHKKGGKE